MPEPLITQIISNGAIYVSFDKNIARDQRPQGEIERGIHGFMNQLTSTHDAIAAARRQVRSGGGAP